VLHVTLVWLLVLATAFQRARFPATGAGRMAPIPLQAREVCALIDQSARLASADCSALLLAGTVPPPLPLLTPVGGHYYQRRDVVSLRKTAKLPRVEMPTQKMPVRWANAIDQRLIRRFRDSSFAVVVPHLHRWAIPCLSLTTSLRTRILGPLITQVKRSPELSMARLCTARQHNCRHEVGSAEG
jgi:hypothetical protein